MPTAQATPDADTSSARLQELLARGDEERLREFKYRFGQSIVFGTPVIALQLWGANLGPTDSERWVSLLQAILCGWVVYVNLGMLVEGVLARRAWLRADFVVALLAVLVYLYSAISAIRGIVTAHLWYRPLLFHVCVIVLAMWSAIRWRGLARKSNRSASSSPRV